MSSNKTPHSSSIHPSLYGLLLGPLNHQTVQAFTSMTSRESLTSILAQACELVAESLDEMEGDSPLHNMANKSKTSDKKYQGNGPPRQ